MSDTPITDEVASHPGNWDTKALRMGNFARKLERELNATIKAKRENDDRFQIELTESRAEAMTYNAVAKILYSALHDTNPHFVEFYSKHSPENLLKGYDELHAKNRNAMDAFEAAEVDG